MPSYLIRFSPRSSARRADVALPDAKSAISARGGEDPNDSSRLSVRLCATVCAEKWIEQRLAATRARVQDHGEKSVHEVRAKIHTCPSCPHTRVPFSSLSTFSIATLRHHGAAGAARRTRALSLIFNSNFFSRRVHERGLRFATACVRRHDALCARPSRLFSRLRRARRAPGEPRRASYHKILTMRFFTERAGGGEDAKFRRGKIQRVKTSLTRRGSSVRSRWITIGQLAANNRVAGLGARTGQVTFKIRKGSV